MRIAPRWLFTALLPAVLLAGCGGGSDTETDATSSGGSKPAAKPVIIALAVDADRDGVADPANENDRAHRDEWTATFGASFLANLDDDDSDGVADAEDDKVNGDDDLLDLAPISIAAWPDAPDGAVGKVTVDAASAPVVRVFKKGLDGQWTAVLGSLGACTAGPRQPCASQALEATLTVDEVRAGVSLGIEARRFHESSDDPWSGDTELTFSVLDKEGGKPFTSKDAPDGVDHAKLRVAPWVLNGNLSPFDTVYASSFSAPFVTGITSAATASGVTFKKISNYDDQWVQDFFQTAWTAIPGPGGVVHGLRVANARPWGQDTGTAHLPITWLKKNYLGPDRGVLEIYKQPNTGTSFDSHGNHDLLPPYVNDAKQTSFPLGRILTGSGILPETGAFYDAQAVQGPHLAVVTDWLYVGHVDEFLSYVPAATPRGWKLLVASTSLAKTMLEKAQSDGNGAVHMFVGKQRYVGDTDQMISAEVSIDDVLANTDLMQWCQEAQTDIDAVVAVLKDEIGLGDDEIVEVPTIFEDTMGYKIAWAPGMVNMLVLHDVVAPPDPFGPQIGGVDIFKQDMQARLGTSANALGSAGAGLNIQFVNDWDLYHILDGEVHCGSNPETSAPFASVKWWETGR